MPRGAWHSTAKAWQSKAQRARTQHSKGSAEQSKVTLRVAQLGNTKMRRGIAWLSWAQHSKAKAKQITAAL
ncbi:MAG: hypothetical protein ACETVZ_00235 [Phycisphaerae bacterium]